MKEVKLSIIVPVYNTEKYIVNCLDSLVNQNLEEIEIICVNDGSTDRSLEILERYAGEDERIQIITKENDGLGAARNTGIDAAQGKYIGFVDSDDFADPNMFRLLVKAAESADADVAIGNVYLYYDDSKKTVPYRDQKFYQTLNRVGVFRAKDVPEIVENIGVWDRIYRRQFIENHKLRNPEHVIYEDALFSFQTSVLAERLVECSEAVYFYRKNTGSAITDKEVWLDSYKFDFLKNNFLIRDFLIEQNVYEIYKASYWKYFYTNALWHQSNILQYADFKRFFMDARRMMVFKYKIQALLNINMPWKAKIYITFLLFNLPGILFGMFYPKRRKRKMLPGK